MPTVGASVSRDLHERVLAEVKRRGITRSEFVRELLKEAMRAGSDNPGNPPKNPGSQESCKPSRETIHVTLADELREPKKKKEPEIIHVTLADELKDKRKRKEERESLNLRKGLVLGSISGANCEDGECNHQHHDWPVSPRFREIATRKMKEANPRESGRRAVQVKRPPRAEPPTSMGRVRRSPWKAVGLALGGGAALILGIWLVDRFTGSPEPAPAPEEPA